MSEIMGTKSEMLCQFEHIYDKFLQKAMSKSKKGARREVEAIQTSWLSASFFLHKIKHVTQTSRSGSGPGFVVNCEPCLNLVEQCAHHNFIRYQITGMNVLFQQLSNFGIFEFTEFGFSNIDKCMLPLQTMRLKLRLVLMLFKNDV